MAGIYRSVEIMRRPIGADIMDYAVQADMDGQLSVLVHLRRTITPLFAGRQAGRQLTAELYNDEQLNPRGGCKMGRCLWETLCIINTSTASDNSTQCRLHGVVDRPRVHFESEASVCGLCIMELSSPDFRFSM
jgi:hypothetical protein